MIRVTTILGGAVKSGMSREIMIKKDEKAGADITW
jgi:hypothetical protein